MRATRESMLAGGFRVGVEVAQKRAARHDMLGVCLGGGEGAGMLSLTTS